MAKHFAGAIWSFRWPLTKKPNGLVRTYDKKSLQIELDGVAGKYDFVTNELKCIVDRRTARLLAKRILDCLEKTK